MAEPSFTDPQTWFAGLPGVVVAAGALITDPRGRVVLVKPNYRDLWALPGGICEHGEPPQQGCGREVAEELGLNISVGRLLSADWSQPYGTEQRPIMHFVFDGGQVTDGGGIVLQESELDGFRFTTPAELPEYLPAHGLPRVTAALAARQSGTAIYVPHNVLADRARGQVGYPVKPPDLAGTEDLREVTLHGVEHVGHRHPAA